MNCIDNVPATTEDGRSWQVALEEAAGAARLEATITNVTLDEASLNRVLRIATGGGTNSSVGSASVLLEGCTMKGVEAVAGGTLELPGTRQVAVTLKGCGFEGNRINATGAVAVQESLSVTLKLLDTGQWGVALRHVSPRWPARLAAAAAAMAPAHSLPSPPPSLPTVLRGNKVLAVGAAAVGTTAQLSFQLAEGATVVDNELDLWGGLAVGGDGSLAASLVDATVTGNKLNAAGVVALGGNASVTVDGVGAASVNVSSNTNTGRVYTVQQQPAVASALAVVLGSGACCAVGPRLLQCLCGGLRLLHRHRHLHARLRPACHASHHHHCSLPLQPSATHS